MSDFDAAPDARRGRRRGSPPAAVWALTVLHALVLVCTAVVYPVFRAPDETAHVDLALALAGGAAYLEPMQRRVSERLRSSYPDVLWAGSAVDEPLPGDAAPPRTSRRPLTTTGPDVPSTITNQMAQHPPLYYELAARVARSVGALEPDGPGVGAVVVAMRLLSVALVAPLPLLAHRAGLQLTGREELAVVAAALPLGVPMLTHIGSAVNNDNLLVPMGGLLVVLLLGVASGRDGLARAAVVGAMTGLALLTKGFALTMPAWVLAAYAIAAVRTGRGLRAFSAAALTLGVAYAVGGWWWTRNLVRYGTIQPTGAVLPEASPGFEPQPVEWARLFVTRFTDRFWLEPNVVPEAVPPVEGVAMVALLALVLAGAIALRRSAGLVAVALVPVATLLALVVFGGWRYLLQTGAPFGIHGRYLYPGMVGVWALAAAGAGWLGRRWLRWLPLVAVVAVAVAQIGGLLLALNAYWAGDSLPARFSAMLAWSPWPVAVTAGAFAASAIAALTALTVAARSS